MPLIPLQLPAGVYRNGSAYQAKGRWIDSNLIRWSEGVMAPVGGWSVRVTITDKPPRGTVVWRDLSGDRWIAAGTYEKLFAASASGVVTDITPAGLVVGTADAETNTGYGGGPYGAGAYGTVRPEGGAFTAATTWSLNNFGEFLVACSSTDGKIYEWDLNTLGDAAAVANAPVDNSGIVVTDERFLFALGAGGNFRKVQWCDREDNTVWTPLATNEAGDIELQTSGTIQLGVRARGLTLILTDTDAHTATYIGPPFVYGFERVGSACGAISRQAAANIDGGVIWMGRNGFHRFMGGAVESIPCEVTDYVFGRLNTSQASKVVAVSNAGNDEVWFFYPNGIENDSYVVYNFKENHWTVGSLARTAGVDNGVFRDPIWFSPSGVAYNHETGYDWGGAQPYAESGPIEAGAGEQVIAAVELIPDEKTQGDVTATFKTKFHPNDVEREYGPYSMANPTSVRFSGRQIAMRVTSANPTSWRWGVPRIDLRLGGRR